jgi:ABC-type lipoprotein export system ATPase subunit
MTDENIDCMTARWEEVKAAYPSLEKYLAAMNIAEPDPSSSLEAYLADKSDSFFEDRSIDRDSVADNIAGYLGLQTRENYVRDLCHEITIMGGRDKDGKPENLNITVRIGEITCLVGPTGSGKSRFLADIECLAQGDTPSGRRILIDNDKPTRQRRFSSSSKLVAQLSQNMNFVMDLSVWDFLMLHIRSRIADNPEEVAQHVLSEANALAGEPFTADMPVSMLSGGQSRALMISDTASVSSSPIILIDELENAGIDRRKAMELLIGEKKIVFISTHDPLLALLGNQRVVMRNGAVNSIIRRNAGELANLPVMQQFEDKRTDLREVLRTGGRIDFDLKAYLSSDKRETN